LESIGALDGYFSYVLDYPIVDIFIDQTIKTIVYATTKKLFYGFYDTVNGITLKNSVDIPDDFP
jgi:hypothetical protein